MPFWFLTTNGELPENNVDYYNHEEAEVPRPFTFCDEEHIAPGVHKYAVGMHKDAQKPPSLPMVPEPPYPDVGELPAFEYKPLDIERDEIRLLVLMPHLGHPTSPLQCHLIHASLTHDRYCFIAVENTRGYPFLRTKVFMNQCSKEITNNQVVFLRDIRMECKPVLLWIRELCINRDDLEERNMQLTQARIDWIFGHCCKYMDMATALDDMVDQGKIQFEVPSREKKWNALVRPAHLDKHFPRHWPIHLGAYRGPDAAPLPHRYLPLDPIAGEIRLVVLRPAKDPSDPLVAHFAHEPLAGDAAYHCLSYTWGDVGGDCQIELNGQIKNITQNLDQALRTLRLREGSFVVWIDAICIDQESIKEKSHQVRRMHSIYTYADAVLIWLGPGDEDSDIAMDFILEINGPENTLFEDQPAAPEASPILKSEERQAKAWAALLRLLSRPYFTRTWIVQELAAASLPTVWCGSKCCGWWKLHQACLLFLRLWGMIEKLWNLWPEHKPSDEAMNTTALLQAYQLTYIRQLHMDENPLSFFQLALVTRSADCTNPIDKIYALLNLATDSEALSLTPEYSKSVQQVYTEFVKAYIRTYRNLDIICASQLHTDQSLPSWCPDWRQKTLWNTFARNATPPVQNLNEVESLDKPLFNAARGTKAAAQLFFNDTTLACAGILVDTIEYVAERPIVKEWFDAAMGRAHRDGKPLSREQIDAEFWSMLNGDPTGQHKSLNGVEEMGSATGVTLWRPATARNAHAPDTWLDMMIRHRRFIITKRGFFGLARGTVEVGMELYILLGCSTPVVLQKHAGHWHFHGDCYVQGWMKGEVLDEMGGTDEEIFQRVYARPPLEIY